MSGWVLVNRRPLAWGGWQFEIEGPSAKKTLEWWPGDSTLMWEGRPFLGARVDKPTGKAAHATIERLLAVLNSDTDDAKDGDR